MSTPIAIANITRPTTISITFTPVLKKPEPELFPPAVVVAVGLVVVDDEEVVEELDEDEEAELADREVVVVR